MLVHFILITTLWRSYYCYLHVQRRQWDTERSTGIAPGHTASRRQSPDSNADYSAPQSTPSQEAALLAQASDRGKEKEGNQLATFFPSWMPPTGREEWFKWLRVIPFWTYLKHPMEFLFWLSSACVARQELPIDAWFKLLSSQCLKNNKNWSWDSRNEMIMDGGVVKSMNAMTRLT